MAQKKQSQKKRGTDARTTLPVLKVKSALSAKADHGATFDDLHNRVLTCIGSIQRSTWELGKCLLTIRNAELYKPKFKFFKDYIETLHIGRSQTNALMKTVEVWEKFKSGQPDIEKIEMAKLYAIRQVAHKEADPNDLKDWLDKADKLRVKDLRVAIKELRNGNDHCVKVQPKAKKPESSVKVLYANVHQLVNDIKEITPLLELFVFNWTEEKYEILSDAFTPSELHRFARLVQCLENPQRCATLIDQGEVEPAPDYAHFWAAQEIRKEQADFNEAQDQTEAVTIDDVTVES